MTDRVTAPYGAWPSPIAASDVSRGERLLGSPSVIGAHTWWEESRPEEGGRTTVMHRGADGTVAELLAAPWDAHTRVHEYGGRSYLPVPRRDDKAITRYGVVFSNLDDQRLYLLEPGAAAPRPISPEPHAPAALRYADFALSPDGKRVICVRESHPEPAAGGAAARPRRAIVSLPLSGRAAEDPGAVTELVSGADFYAWPTPSPDGRHLVWVSWNHPRMPWDGTELRVGTLADGAVSNVYTLKGGINESVLAPVWRDDSTVSFVSDWPGWWNLYEIGLTGPAIALYPAEEEFAHGFTRLGDRPYTRLADGRLVALSGHADLTPGVYDPATAELTPLDTGREGLTSWLTLESDGDTVVGLAGGPRTPLSLVRLDPRTGRTEVLRRAAENLPDPGYLPEPRAITVSGRYGAAVHATVYPPTHPGVEGEGPAPYVVWAHGGPVGKALGLLDLAKAFYTSRGIGILDVNYGGSVGFGRTYRERLHGQWGVVDVEDVTAAARALVEQGAADLERLAVRGNSAGGLTTLLALTGDTFACGTSAWGVTDLLRLAGETHDFESRYLDGLVGPLPGYAATYRERSPIDRADELARPVLLLQGSADPVVPANQAHALAASLSERGIRHALIEFEGEGHGLRAADNRRRALEAELAFYGEVFGFTPEGAAPIALSTDYAPVRVGAASSAGGAAGAEAAHDPEGETDLDLVAEPLPPLDAHEPRADAQRAETPGRGLPAGQEHGEG
ncbi:S9 family peptidase [Streptomonospora nanhaiensis]|uniref:S9 family peptidase n=1 Tax=Streptomonospora nanhaiensis TaxID=1323731 RepID=UPI001C99FF46|nr:prolyl oligopeptidase family serine peptidase [Streptomonospora nanhaiensis]MBX9391117.1 prolyl oligopeptidase family serine peptidase [Streptomonospora nanhaiensis]